jgi:thiol:disulfide interchange protein DsbA
MNKAKVLSIGLITMALSACGGESKLEAKDQELAKSKVEKVVEKVSKSSTEVLLGVDYKKLDNPVNIAGIENNSVLEIFWLGCPHCQSFEPAVRAWKKSNPNVNFVKMPAITTNPRWTIDATIYNTLVMVGGTEKDINGLFDMYINQMKDYQSAPENAKPKAYPAISDIFKFVEKQGLDLDKFKELMSSEEMREVNQKNAEIFNDAKLSGVPAFIVNGQYLITGKNVKSYEEYFEKVNAVIEKTNK